MKRRLPGLDLAALTDEFADAAQIHGDASRDGDSRAANCAYKRIKEAEARLVNGGAAGREALLGLLDASSIAVRGWAAACMLRLGSERALAVLEEIAAGPPSLERLSAEMLLREWKQRLANNGPERDDSHRGL